MSNHSLWKTCTTCGKEYDLRADSGICPSCFNEYDFDMTDNDFNEKDFLKDVEDVCSQVEKLIATLKFNETKYTGLSDEKMEEIDKKFPEVDKKCNDLTKELEPYL